MRNESDKLDEEVRKVSSIIEQIAANYPKGSDEDIILRKCTVSYLWVRAYHGREFSEYLRKIPGMGITS